MAPVHRIFIQLARPRSPDDPGAAEVGHFILEGDALVVLCDSTGVPLKRPKMGVRRREEPPTLFRYERRLREGEDPRRVARELLLQKWKATKKGTDFSKPLRYSNAGII
jgi:hypothetical protein